MHFATLALFGACMAHASTDWERIPDPPPGNFHLISSNHSEFAAVLAEDGSLRFKHNSQETWSKLFVGSVRPWSSMLSGDRLYFLKEDSIPTVFDLRSGAMVASRTDSITVDGSANNYLVRFSANGSLSLLSIWRDTHSFKAFLGRDSTSPDGTHNISWKAFPKDDQTGIYPHAFIGKRLFAKTSLRGDPKTFLASEDTGRTWRPLPGRFLELTGSDDTLLAASESNRLYRSLDGGFSWDSTSRIPATTAPLEWIGGTLWARLEAPSRISFSQDLGKSWTEVPEALYLPSFDGTAFLVHTPTSLQKVDLELRHREPAPTGYSTSLLRHLAPFRTGIIARMGQSPKPILWSRGSWEVLDESIGELATGSSSMVALKFSTSPGSTAATTATLSRSFDGRNWTSIVDGATTSTTKIVGDGNRRFAAFDGEDIRLSEDDGISWSRLGLGIKGSTGYTCSPDGFDHEGNLICSTVDSMYWIDSKGPHAYAEYAFERPYGRSWRTHLIEKHGYAFMTDTLLFGKDTLFGFPTEIALYRDSLLASTNSGIWVLHDGGLRRMSTSELPTNTEFATWVPDGRGLPDSQGDSVLLARDADQHYWVRSARSTALGSRAGGRRFSLSSRGAFVDLGLKAPATVGISLVTIDGTTRDLLRETRLDAGIHPFEIPSSTGSVLLVRAIIDGRTTTLAIPPNRARR